MENTANKLGKCFACYSGYECEPQKIDPLKESALVAMFSDFNQMLYTGLFGEITSCTMEQDYERYKGLIEKHQELLRYNDEMLFLKQIGEDDGNDIYLNENGRLCWYWEYDDDYTGGSSGIMPFCYSEEEAGQTWAFSEVKSISERAFMLNKDDDFEGNFEYPDHIKTDEDLLKYVTPFLTNPQQ